MKYTTICLFILTVSVFCQTKRFNRTECKNFACDGDNFCFQGFCNSCEGPRSIWEKRKPQWGFQVGEAFGVAAFSNFGDADVLDSSKDEFLEQSQTNLPDDIYIGQKYQCVHYARKFWINQFYSYFGSVDTAEQIFGLDIAFNFSTQTNVTLQTFVNGGNEAPQFGDLLIWQKDENNYPYGHVAVIIEIDTASESPTVVIAEQNYDQTWDTRNFSRALKLIVSEDGTYTVLNKRQTFPTKDDLKCRDPSSDESIILGWKRLQLN